MFEVHVQIAKLKAERRKQTTTKDIDWDLFVHAMNNLQFNARNLGGSGVAFEHPSSKKIIFHRRHLVAKVDSVILQ
jgi:hypothetical protein